MYFKFKDASQTYLNRNVRNISVEKFSFFGKFSFTVSVLIVLQNQVPLCRL